MAFYQFILLCLTLGVSIHHAGSASIRNSDSKHSISVRSPNPLFPALAVINQLREIKNQDGTRRFPQGEPGTFEDDFLNAPPFDAGTGKPDDLHGDDLFDCDHGPCEPEFLDQTGGGNSPILSPADRRPDEQNFRFPISPPSTTTSVPFTTMPPHDMNSTSEANIAVTSEIPIPNTTTATSLSSSSFPEPDATTQPSSTHEKPSIQSGEQETTTLRPLTPESENLESTSTANMSTSSESSTMPSEISTSAPLSSTSMMPPEITSETTTVTTELQISTLSSMPSTSTAHLSDLLDEQTTMASTSMSSSSIAATEDQIPELTTTNKSVRRDSAGTRSEETSEILNAENSTNSASTMTEKKNSQIDSNFEGSTASPNSENATQLPTSSEFSLTDSSSTSSLIDLEASASSTSTLEPAVMSSTDATNASSVESESSSTVLPAASLEVTAIEPESSTNIAPEEEVTSVGQITTELSTSSSSFSSETPPTKLPSTSQAPGTEIIPGNSVELVTTLSPVDTTLRFSEETGEMTTEFSEQGIPSVTGSTSEEKSTSESTVTTEVSQNYDYDISTELTPSEEQEPDFLTDENENVPDDYTTNSEPDEAILDQMKHKPVVLKLNFSRTSPTYNECKYEDIEKFKRSITTATFGYNLKSEPSLLTFADGSPCVGVFSDMGQDEILSIRKLWPTIDPKAHVDVAGFADGHVYFIESTRSRNRPQMVQSFNYDSSRNAYDETSIKMSTTEFLQSVCGIQPSHSFRIKSFLKLPNSSTCFVFKETSRRALVSPNATSSELSLLHSIEHLLQTEYVNYVQAIFVWADEPSLSIVYVYGSNGELYVVHRNLMRNSPEFGLWKPGNFVLIPYEQFPA